MTNSISLHLSETLDSQRTALLPQLLLLKSSGYILWGGTALALIFGHRQSIDFDFFISQDIDTSALFADCLQIFADQSVQKIFESHNTLYISVDGVKISFFAYHHPPIQALLESEYFQLYHIRDIAAMKLRAIQNRATNKDYVDLYYLIRELGLQQILQDFVQKFWPVVSESYLLKSLIYFEDLDNEPLVLTDQSLSFEDVQKFLIEEVTSHRG